MSGYEVQAFRLDGPTPTEPVAAKQGSGIRGLNNLRLVGVSDAGRVFLDPIHELRIYAAEGAFPRIGRLSRDFSGSPCGWLGEELCVRVRGNEVVGVNLQNPTAPVLAHQWQTETSWRPLAIGPTGLLYVAVGETMGVVQAMAATDLARQVVDAAALRRAYTAARAMDAAKAEPSRRYRAERAAGRLEEGGVRRARSQPVPGMAPQELARILHDYARWLALAEKEDAVIPILRRALQLDPQRPALHLDLAVALRRALASVVTFVEKVALSQEIIASYRQYLALGGTPHTGLTVFQRDNLVTRPPADVCTAVRQYARAGRLSELFGNGEGVRAADGRLLRLVTDMQGTGHFPTLDAYDAETDERGDLPSPVPEGASGNEYAVIPFRDGHYVLLYQDLRHPLELVPIGATEGPTCRF
jgi:hypothetical protein